MKRRIINNVKLGLFVMAGLLFLIVLLYLIGKNRQLFGASYSLKARFENVQGLVPGNNVRYSGISVGTVRSIKIINDTMIEVSMSVDVKMKKVIRKNALVSIGTDGLVGNRIININPSGNGSVALAVENDILAVKKSADTDDMLLTLAGTNKDIALIAEELKGTIQRINNSTVIRSLLEDPGLPMELKRSLLNLRSASGKANSAMGELAEFLADINRGSGTLGTLIKDSSTVISIDETLASIRGAGEKADSLLIILKNTVYQVKQELQDGNGLVNKLFTDSLLVLKLYEILDNAVKGTEGFNQDMEALKHSIFLRGYFRKLERQQKKKDP